MSVSRLGIVRPFWVRPAQAEVNAIGVDADDQGSFAIREVDPGRYSLTAAWDGFLTSSVGMVRLPQTFAIGAKESIANLRFPLRAFAVMAAAFPSTTASLRMNVQVEADREYRIHPHHGPLLAGTAANIACSFCSRRHISSWRSMSVRNLPVNRSGMQPS